MHTHKDITNTNGEQKKRGVLPQSETTDRGIRRLYLLNKWCLQQMNLNNSTLKQDFQALWDIQCIWFVYQGGKTHVAGLKSE